MLIVFLILSILQLLGYFVFQDYPELFPWGAVLYDEILFGLSLAYISSRMFYVITVRYPYRKRFKTVEPIIVKRLQKLVDDYTIFLKELWVLDYTGSLDKNALNTKLNSIDLYAESSILRKVRYTPWSKYKFGELLSEINQNRESISTELLNTYHGYLPHKLMACLLDMQEAALFVKLFKPLATCYDKSGEFIIQPGPGSLLSQIGSIDDYTSYYQSIKCIKDMITTNQRLIR